MLSMRGNEITGESAPKISSLKGVDMSRENFEQAVNMLEGNEDSLNIVGQLPESTVADAEQRLGIVFPPMFREYLLRFGQLQIGSQEIYGLMGDKYPGGAVPDFLWLTEDLRLSLGFPKHFLPIADLGDGRLYAIDVSRSDPGGESPIVLLFPSRQIPATSVETAFSDFGDFLLDQVLKGLEA